MDQTYNMVQTVRTLSQHQDKIDWSPNAIRMALHPNEPPILPQELAAGLLAIGLVYIAIVGLLLKTGFQL